MDTYGDIPDGLCVLHRCDNRLCVRPDHLFLGTYLDNCRDKIAKGRSGNFSGELNGRAKLTKMQVDRIRADYTKGDGRRMAGIYGVSKTTILRIVAGELWPEKKQNG